MYDRSAPMWMIDRINELESKLTKVSYELIKTKRSSNEYIPNHVFVNFSAIQPIIGICKRDGKTIIGYYNKVNEYSELCYDTSDEDHCRLVYCFKNSLDGGKCCQ